jgi:hypothetical protein
VPCAWGSSSLKVVGCISLLQQLHRCQVLKQGQHTCAPPCISMHCSSGAWSAKQAQQWCMAPCPVCQCARQGPAGLFCASSLGTEQACSQQQGTHRLPVLPNLLCCGVLSCLVMSAMALVCAFQFLPSHTAHLCKLGA